VPTPVADLVVAELAVALVVVVAAHRRPQLAAVAVLVADRGGGRVPPRSGWVAAGVPARRRR
jgi:hypothetical protein